MQIPLPFPNSRRLRTVGLFAIAWMCLATTPLTAQVRWDGGGGNNFWGTANNWDPNGVPGAATNVLFDNTFVNPLPATIELRDNRNASTLTFDTNNNVSLVNGTGTRILDLWGGSVVQTATSSGTHSLDFTNLRLRATTTFDIRGSGPFTVGAGISEQGGSYSLTKDGGGLLILTAANTFTGNVNLNDGTVRVTTNANLGSDASAVRFDGGTLNVAGSFTSSVGRVFDVIAGGGTMDIDTGVTLTLAASNNRLTGSGTLTREGGGTLVIQNSNTFSGDVVLQDGITQLNNRAGFGTNAAATVTINGGAELVANWGAAVNFDADIVINDGTIRRIGNFGQKAGFQNNNASSSLTVTGTGNIIRDGTGGVGGFLTLDGVVDVQNGATLNLIANTGEVRLGGSQDILIGSGAAVKTSGASFVSFGSGAARTIIGAGTSTSESLVRLDATTTANPGSRLRVNGTGTGGLRIEGNAVRVNVLANDTRLNQIQGTGGTLTIAFADNSTRTFTAASNAAAATNVKLGFDNANGSAPTYNINADHSNWGGLVVKGGQVNLNAAQGDFTHGIEISGGTLSLGASDRIGNATNMTLSGGIFETGGYSDALNTLTLTDDSRIDLGSGSSILAFADSSALAWTSGKTLFIDNWSGLLAGGGTDQLYIGTNSSGVTPAQLSQIKFVDPFGLAPGIYAAKILASGEIVPVPEPETVFASLFLAILAAWRSRQRLRDWWVGLRDGSA